MSSPRQGSKCKSARRKKRRRAKVFRAKPLLVQCVAVIKEKWTPQHHHRPPPQLSPLFPQKKSLFWPWRNQTMNILLMAKVFCDCTAQRLRILELFFFFHLSQLKMPWYRDAFLHWSNVGRRGVSWLCWRKLKRKKKEERLRSQNQVHVPLTEGSWSKRG